MKLVLFDDYKPGLLKGNSVIDISGATQRVAGKSGQETMQGIITDFEALRPELNRQLSEGKEIPVSSVKLQAPLPKPGKVICMGVNYLEFTKGTPAPIMVFLKSPEAVIGNGDTVTLPPADFNICHHEAEFTVVIGKKGKNVPQAQWLDYIFGYTCGVDVSCRGEFGGNSFIGKSFDGCAPLGPCIVTKDEIADPHKLQVRFWVDGQPRHDYNTDDMAHRIPECIEYTSSIMTILPGDVLLLGTNHQGIGPLQDGETAEMEVEGVGRLMFKVSDPRKRSWPKSIDTEMAARVKSRFQPAAAR